jgi:hypothetical protein
MGNSLSCSVLMNSKPSRRKAAKNWFDSDDEIDDAKSLHSSESTIMGRDEEEGNAGPRRSQLDLDQPFAAKGTTTEVSAGTGIPPGWNHGVKVTRQVIVETSSR